MKTPIRYYGGKQNLISSILPLIPEHKLYCEPFTGGGALFFKKEPSEVEVLNDTNNELINFYKVIQTDFDALKKEILSTLHSRRLHQHADIVYKNPDLFSEVKRAWALWVLSSQSFSGKLDGSFGYDKTTKATSKNIANKRNNFTTDYSTRLQHVQIENADAIYIIKSRDSEDAFFYCDPPYYNSDCAHYGGYSINDFEALLKTLANIKGKFLLSSYPSDILHQYQKDYNWYSLSIDKAVAVNCKSGIPKRKTEVLTANYVI